MQKVSLTSQQEVSLLLLSLATPLPHNLAQLLKVLDKTACELVVQLKCSESDNEYDLQMSHLITYYTFINNHKADNPFFDSTVAFFEANGQIYDGNLQQFQQVFVDKQLESNLPNQITLENPSQTELEYIDQFLNKNLQEYVDIINGKKEGNYKGLKTSSKDRVALGGTFDHIHVGHKILLSSALILSKGEQKIVCGIAGSGLLAKKKNGELLESFATRSHSVLKFSQIFDPKKVGFQVFELVEPMGPLKDQDFDALVISYETLTSASQINQFRKMNNLSEHPLIVIDVIGPEKSGQEFQQKASSTDIRNYLLLKNQLSCEQFKLLTTNWNSLFPEENNSLVQELLDRWLDKLKGLYSQPWRSYHTLQHVLSLLEINNEYQDKIQYKREANLAIWFHDAIYNPLRHDNEARSEELFLQFIEELNSKGYSGKINSDAIAIFIRATASHTQRDYFKEDEVLQKELNLFLDMDLSVLGAENEVYKSYCKAIKFEYQHFSNEQFRIGRSTVMQKFLAEGDIYRSEELKSRFEERARENISNEIKELLEQSVN